MAALQGDLFQQAPRRLFVRTLSSRQPVYSYRKSSSVPQTTAMYSCGYSERYEPSRRTWCRTFALSLRRAHSYELYATQAHGTELANVFGGGDMGDHLIRFAATLDPNTDGAAHWPRYTTTSPNLLTFNDSDGARRLSITHDTYRSQGMEYLTRLSLADPM